jgi:hypothetical protein
MAAPPRLLSRTLAAEEWGWREGTRLRDLDADEGLRELLLYAEGRIRRRWTITPHFKTVYEKTDAIDPSEDCLEVRMLPPTILLREATVLQNDFAWHHMSVSALAVPLRRTHMQWLYELTVEPTHLGRASTSPRPCIYITYRLDEASAGRCHYYVRLMDWIARCADPRECVALLDAIASNLPAIERDRDTRVDAYTLYAHLRKVLIRHHDHDAPRCDYIQRTMHRLLEEGQRQELVLL